MGKGVDKSQGSKMKGVEGGEIMVCMQNKRKMLIKKLKKNINFWEK